MKNISAPGQARRHQPGDALLCAFVGALLALIAPAHGVAQITWTCDNNPVLGPGAGWDSSWVGFVSVIDQDSQYVMWYGGGDNPNGVNLSAGRATSTDGKLWTRDALNPVLRHSSSTWDDEAAWIPKVLKIGNGYTMWFTGANSSDVWQIGRATSSDGRVWVQDTSNPVIQVGAPGQWDAALVHTGSVLFDGTKYRMWYTGLSTWYSAGGFAGIGLATSVDGIHWFKDLLNNPVLEAGPPGAWDQDGVGECSVVFDNVSKRYLMFYDGNELDYFQAGTSGIGYAWSVDGIHWTKFAGNPVLSNNLAGSWTTVASAPFVLLRDDTLHMWYAGEGAGAAGIALGYATAPLVISGVTENSSASAVRDFLLQQNYPNPFNPSTTIQFELPKASRVSLKVYDVLGREVSTLVDDEKPAGTYEVQFRAEHLSSGMYVYRLQAGDYVATKKLILLR